MNNSSIFKLNKRDLIKGLVVAGLTGGLTALQQMITLTPPHLDLKQVGIIAITSMIGYLIKNFVTDENDKIDLKMIGSRPKKKKPVAIFPNGLGFREYDFELDSIVLCYSDLMNGEAVVIENIDSYSDGQIVKFQNVSYNDFESLVFELQ